MSDIVFAIFDIISTTVSSGENINVIFLIFLSLTTPLLEIIQKQKGGTYKMYAPPFFELLFLFFSKPCVR